MEPIKFDIKAEQNEFNRFIDTIKSKQELTQTSFTPSDDKNHFVIYKFLVSGDKCVVVYDTKACKISLTAKADVLERFKTLFFSENKSVGAGVPQKPQVTAKPAGQGSSPKKQTGKKDGKQGGTVQAQKQANQPQPQKQSVQQPQKQVNQPQKQAAKQQRQQTCAKPAETTEAPEYKNGYCIKKYTRKRLNDALAAIKAMKGVTYKADSTDNKGKPNETETYIVSGKNGQKVILRYLPKKETLQMQGKRSYLFSDVQVQILKGSDFKEAVGSTLSAGEGKKAPQSASTEQRRLKKILPNAFDYLSEQSKIYLTIGLIDISNDNNHLSDYSSLLTPPYRGLEKFISDLQRAKGIEVKMIGQGYEKDDNGNYRLKSGYRKRIDSVVYNEVMSALYTEYYSSRNFYLHSDVTGAEELRIITDKQELKRIFDNLIRVIDYNSKKLKEIGFSLK